MVDRRPTDTAESMLCDAAAPTPAAAGSGHGPGGSGLGAYWASLGEASRRTLGMLTAAMMTIIVATIGAGLYTTERYADLAYAFMTEQTQTVLDMAVADLVWNDYRQGVSGLAGEIAGDLRQPFAAGDAAALSAVLADAGRRDAVSSGAIGLLGAQVLDLELATLASSGLTEGGLAEAGPAAPVAAFLAGRDGNDRLVTEPVVWLDDGRPVMTMVAPLGGLRLAGYLLVHTDLAPALAGLDSRVGLELVVRSLDGARTIAALDGFRNAPDAVTRPARLRLHGPVGVDETTATILAQIDGVIETTALSDALAARRLGYIALSIVLGLGLAAGAIALVAQRLRRAEAARSAAEATSAAEQIATRRRLADDLEREFRGFAETMAATASRFEGYAEGVAGSARSASGQSRAALDDGAEVAERTTAVAAAAEELTVSIREVGRQAAEARTVVQKAEARAQTTDALVRELAAAAERVGGVIGLIQDVASRTSLLALNASIEAARAGEQGRGFAVVATEVKDLAGQTAEATREIAAQVAAMGATIQAANDALGAIGNTVRRVAGITETVDEAVDGQAAATVQIAYDIRAVVEATEATARRLGAIVENADTAGEATADLMAGAGQLGHEARALLERVDAMLDRLRAA